jgi:hypothetical protein
MKQNYTNRSGPRILVVRSTTSTVEWWPPSSSTVQLLVGWMAFLVSYQSQTRPAHVCQLRPQLLWSVRRWESETYAGARLINFTFIGSTCVDTRLHETSPSLCPSTGQKGRQPPAIDRRQAAAGSDSTLVTYGFPRDLCSPPSDDVTTDDNDDPSAPLPRPDQLRRRSSIDQARLTNEGTDACVSRASREDKQPTWPLVPCTCSLCWLLPSYVLFHPELFHLLSYYAPINYTYFLF